MTALFTRPLTFTTVNGNQAATALVSNLAENEAGQVWKSSNLTTVYMIIDLTAVASYDTVALIGSNLRASDTIQIRTGTTSTGIGSYAGTATAAFTGTKPDAFTTKSVFRLPSTRTERYMRIDIVATSHPDTFVQAQRLVVGKAITTLGVDYDAEQTIIDPTSINSSGGADVYESLPNKMRWKFGMSWVGADSWHSEWLGFLARVGKTEPILFVPFVEDAALFNAQVIFGRIRNDVSGKARSNMVRSIDLTIEGIAL